MTNKDRATRARAAAYALRCYDVGDEEETRIGEEDADETFALDLLPAEQREAVRDLAADGELFVALEVAARHLARGVGKPALRDAARQVADDLWDAPADRRREARAITAQFRRLRLL